MQVVSENPRSQPSPSIRASSFYRSTMITSFRDHWYNRCIRGRKRRITGTRDSTARRARHIAGPQCRCNASSTPSFY